LHSLLLLPFVTGVRGVTVLGASGDGGSHFSFGPFEGGAIANTLNKISCEFQMPVFPTASPYVLSVGGETWQNEDPAKPIAWEGSGACCVCMHVCGWRC
jgi:subtilase family serine protease